MTKTYIEWIDQQLEHHQREVARLTIAREVVVEAAAALAPKPEKKPRVFVSILPKKEKKPKVKSDVRENMVEMIKNVGPVTAGMAIDLYSAKNKQERQQVYNALSTLRLAGKLIKDDKSGIYSLPVEEPVAQAG